MEQSSFLAFVTATAIMIALPGPSVLLTVAHGISFGWRRALATVAGATAGIAVQLLVAVVAVVALASLMRGIAELFGWLRWFGVAYLVYLGVRLWLSPGEAPEPEAQKASGVPKAPGKRLFSQGLVATIFNPKSLVFIAAFLPQFIDSRRPLGAQLGLMIPSFLAITFIVTSAWALVAGKARKFLRSRRAFQATFRAAGALMIVAALGLALARDGA
jgi:homoserine/homoserine lactone efflux protein